MTYLVTQEPASGFDAEVAEEKLEDFVTQFDIPVEGVIMGHTCLMDT